MNDEHTIDGTAWAKSLRKARPYRIARRAVILEFIRESAHHATLLRKK